MSEVKKLEDRLEKMKDNGLQNMHMSWAEGADKLSPEERAKAINEVLDASDKYHAMTPEEKLWKEYEELADVARSVMKDLKMDVREWDRLSSREVALRSRAVGQLAMALCGCNELREMKRKRLEQSS